MFRIICLSRQEIKYSLKDRVLELTLGEVIFISLSIMAIIFMFTFYGQYNYKHIPTDGVQDVLHRGLAPNLKMHYNKIDCDYDDVLKNERSMNSWEVPTKFHGFSLNGIENGSYFPEHCKPAFSVAMLVTYRNRKDQLSVFLPYMHIFLRKQNIHYKIFVIEQRDKKPWNKGLLYNIGAKRAIAEQFPCLVLHDVDLLPLDEGNLYACTAHPRHMSASIDKFRFVLPYGHLVGGVTAITSEQYVAVNGFSNKFIKWGGEDDDFAARIKALDLTIMRLPRTRSRYTMLKHHQEPRNSDRHHLLQENRRRDAHVADGFNSIYYKSIDVREHQLFTHIVVTL